MRQKESACRDQKWGNAAIYKIRNDPWPVQIYSKWEKIKLLFAFIYHVVNMLYYLRSHHPILKDAALWRFVATLAGTETVSRTKALFWRVSMFWYWKEPTVHGRARCINATQTVAVRQTFSEGRGEGNNFALSSCKLLIENMPTLLSLTNLRQIQNKFLNFHLITPNVQLFVLQHDFRGEPIAKCVLTVQASNWRRPCNCCRTCAQRDICGTPLCSCGTPLCSMGNCIASSRFVWINSVFASATCLCYVMSCLLHCFLPPNLYCHFSLYTPHLFICT